MSENLTTPSIISIHALLAESDRYSFRHTTQGRHFYPRSPCGERQRRHKKHLISQVISIHALLAESDHVFLQAISRAESISIHALLAESDPFL